MPSPKVDNEFFVAGCDTTLSIVEFGTDFKSSILETCFLALVAGCTEGPEES